MKNLAVLAFPQVFFKRDTGLMFIPAARGDEFQTLTMPHHTGIVSHITECGLTDDSHQGVEVTNVETLSGNIDEELDHLGPLLLLCRLKRGHFLSISILLQRSEVAITLFEH